MNYYESLNIMWICLVNVYNSRLRTHYLIWKHRPPNNKNHPKVFPYMTLYWADAFAIVPTLSRFLIACRDDILRHYYSKQVHTLFKYFWWEIFYHYFAQHIRIKSYLKNINFRHIERYKSLQYPISTLQRGLLASPLESFCK